MTFEQANAAVEKAMQARSAAPTAAAAQPELEPICSAYRILKPILQLISTFLPATWKKAIQDFISVMDRICPSGGDAMGLSGTTSATNFEEADKAIKQALVQHLTAPNMPTPTGGFVGEICGVYKAVRPILQFIATFAPGAWKAGIVAAMAALDALCPGT